ALDRAEREPAERVRERLVALGADAAAADDLLQFFREEATLDDVALRYADVKGVSAAVEHMRGFFEHLDALGVAEFARFDPRIVRGLAYYTGLVFEIFDRAGELRAICGGGRYDRLLGALGGEDLPAVGFGMGDVVLGELLAGRGLLPEHAAGVDYYLVAIADEQRPLVRALAQRLRARGRSALYTLRATGVGRQFKDASARGAARVVVIGPDEVAAGVVVVRDMASGEERRVNDADLVAQA
ncbi:MAG: ATP phosphoribosyltransferase regulatory subunit, partial [Longimicrobiales bacterium]